MLLHELTEARLQPNKDYMEKVGYILDDATREYSKFLEKNNDKDDLDELVTTLQVFTDDDELNISWHVGNTGVKAVDWYIQSAIVHGDGSIDIIIDPSLRPG